MYAYTLLGISPVNNLISVKNNTATGSLLQLDLSFVMRSGRADKLFSPEDIEVLTRVSGLPLVSDQQQSSPTDGRPVLRQVA